MFTKGYKPKWSENIYYIYDIKYNGVWYYIVSKFDPNYIYPLWFVKPIDNLFYYENELIKEN